MMAGAGDVGGGGGTGDRDPLQAALEMSVAETGYSIYELTSGKDGGGGDGGGGGGGMEGKNACIVSTRVCVSLEVPLTCVHAAVPWSSFDA